MIHFPPFRFDPATGELTKDGRPVKLHPQPASVLALLTARAGEVITREEIQRELWDETHVDFDLGINSCVRQIRSALGDDADAPRFVETVPRKGYRFIAATATDRKRRPWLLVGAAAVLAAVVGWTVLSRPPASDAPSPAARVAVFPFHNLADDVQHDWLRLAVPELIMTSLARDAAGVLLPPEHLYRALADVDDVTGDDVERVVTRTGVERFVLGGFAISGGTLRFSVRVHDARSGDILETVRAEGPLEDGVFPIVDRLTAGLAPAIGVGSTRHADVTTSSERALRYYVHAQALRWQRGSEELYRKAVEVDPNFAEALAALAALHSDRGERGIALEYTERAMAHVDRLSPIKRHDVEGRYYSLTRNWSGAIESYRRLHEINPFSHILANRYKSLERHEEAVAILEAIIARGAAYPHHPSYNFRATHNVLAQNYLALGRFADAYRMHHAVTERFPESRWARVGPWAALVTEGRLHEARELTDSAERSGVTRFPQNVNARWLLDVLDEDFDGAREATERLRASKDPYARWSGLYKAALLALYRGELDEAHRSLDVANGVFDPPDPLTVQSQSVQARLYLETGELDKAAALAKQALLYPWSESANWDALVVLALSHARRGDWRAADETAEKLRRIAETFPSRIERRRHHYLLGEHAALRGDWESAVGELEAAAGLLPPRGHFRGTSLMVVSPPHVPIWLALARAYLAVDRAGDARAYLGRIHDATIERVERPLEVRQSRELLAELDS